MKLKIKVITNSKKDYVNTSRNLIRVYVKALPIKGEANKKVIEVLSKHFRVRKSDISIVAGLKSKLKIIEIDGIK